MLLRVQLFVVVVGPLPPRFLNRISTTLRGLYLNDNVVSGHLPTELGLCSRLNVVHLHNNALSGSFSCLLVTVVRHLSLGINNW